MATSRNWQDKAHPCVLCRKRRVKCIRDDPDDFTGPCRPCLQRKVLCEPNLKRRDRCGKRIEQAKALFGVAPTGSGEEGEGRRGREDTLDLDLVRQYFQPDAHFLPTSSAALIVDNFKECGSTWCGFDEAGPSQHGVLLATLLALAARTSTHPALIGSGLLTVPRSVDYIILPHTTRLMVDMGKRRWLPCRLLLERVFRLVDERAVLRVANLPNLITLLLLGRAWSVEDISLKQAQPLWRAAAGHYRTLLEQRDPELRQLLHPDSPVMDTGSSLLISGGMGWSMFAADAMYAAFRGNVPLHFTDDDLQLFRRLCGGKYLVGPEHCLEYFLDSARPESLKTVEGVKWHLWWSGQLRTLLARVYVQRLAGAKAHRRPELDINYALSFLAQLRRVLSALPDLIAAGAPRELARHNMSADGSLHYLVLAFDRLVSHRLIMARSRPESAHTPGYLERLQQLKHISERCAFDSARAFVRIFRFVTGFYLKETVFHSSFVLYESLGNVAYYIAGVRLVDDGGPDGWTRSAKRSCVSELATAVAFLAQSRIGLDHILVFLHRQLQVLENPSPLPLPRPMRVAGPPPPPPSHAPPSHPHAHPHPHPHPHPHAHPHAHPHSHPRSHSPQRALSAHELRPPVHLPYSGSPGDAPADGPCDAPPGYFAPPRDLAPQRSYSEPAQLHDTAPPGQDAGDGSGGGAHVVRHQGQHPHQHPHPHPHPHHPHHPDPAAAPPSHPDAKTPAYPLHLQIGDGYHPPASDFLPASSQVPYGATAASGVAVSPAPAYPLQHYPGYQ